MATDKLHTFYASKPWRDLSWLLKVQRGGRCDRCGSTAATKDDWAQLIGHHTVELTDENVDDPSVSLNPSRVEIICLSCHNKEHRRFGYGRKVYIVWGSPLSGKTTAVREMMRRGDIVLDIDRLWAAVTLLPEYDKPESCRFNIFSLRDCLLDQIKTRYGQWYDAYIIGGYPDKTDRERLASSLGAELIYCEATMQECLDRRREGKMPEALDGYIREWWATFARTG